MAQQENISNCLSLTCGKKLQAVVKHCPFCGVKQFLDTKSNEPIEDSLKSNSSKTIFEEETSAKLSQPVSGDSFAEKDTPSALVTHLTQKTGKELQGVILQNISLDEAKAYDRYAFKKYNGVFVRLDHLHKVPDNLLNQDQLVLKYEEHMVEDDLYDQDEESLNEDSPSTNSQSTKVESTSPNRAQVSPPIDSINGGTTSPDLVVSTPSKSKTKHVIIAFVVILVVLYFIGSNEETVPVVQQGTVTSQVTDCTTAIAEINNYMEAFKPARALTIIEMYKNECKQESRFIELSTNAESLINTAKAKLELAKEYVQKGDLIMAEASAKNALEMDSELIGANELLQEIEGLKIQEQNQQTDPVQTEAANTTEPDQSIPNPTQQNQAALEQRRLESAALQSSAEETKRRQDHEAAEKARLQALERQKAELAKNQDEQKYTVALTTADRALRTKNYGTAKRVAKEILGSSPNNASAMRILRQAEEGESKAFDEMVIE